MSFIPKFSKNFEYIENKIRKIKSGFYAYSRSATFLILLNQRSNTGRIDCRQSDVNRIDRCQIDMCQIDMCQIDMCQIDHRQTKISLLKIDSLKIYQSKN